VVQTLKLFRSLVFFGFSIFSLSPWGHSDHGAEEIPGLFIWGPKMTK
jgi:hypothetical protein